MHIVAVFIKQNLEEATQFADGSKKRGVAFSKTVPVTTDLSAK